MRRSTSPARGIRNRTNLSTPSTARGVPTWRISSRRHSLDGACTAPSNARTRITASKDWPMRSSISAVRFSVAALITDHRGAYVPPHYQTARYDRANRIPRCGRPLQWPSCSGREPARTRPILPAMTASNAPSAITEGRYGAARAGFSSRVARGCWRNVAKSRAASG